LDKNIRKYLIDQCVKGVPIYYEDIGKILNLNLESITDRKILSNTLGDISSYEHSKGRPLISSIVIYKNANDHGTGFYNLCEELGIGKSATLKEKFYGFTQLEESKKYWNNEYNYEQFYDIISPVYNDIENPFISKEEIDFFCNWANKIYDKDNLDHVTSKNYILNTVWYKTRFWSNEVVKRLQEYETSNKRMWSKRDWENGKRVSTFKPYTWARIYKKGNKGKDIFFTIGIDTNRKALIYKLDFFREEESSLSGIQKELCEKYIPSKLKWNEISSDSLINWDWEALISFIVEFIAENSHHYDQLIDLVWKDNDTEEIFNNHLTLREFPDGGLSQLPKLNPNFIGTKTDFSQKSREDKELGDSGEELVKEYEINKLNEKGLKSLSAQVKIVEDGKGFDVLSFDENGNEMYIEVKTTKGNEKTPFYLSLNEKLFSENNSGKYSIYRLYNYNPEKNCADYFIIKEIEKELLFQPTEYKIYLKRK